MKLLCLGDLGRQERASHVLVQCTEVSFSRTGLVLWPVSLERALKELVLQVPEGELGLISSCVGRLASILVTVPAELL